MMVNSLLQLNASLPVYQFTKVGPNAGHLSAGTAARLVRVARDLGSTPASAAGCYLELTTSYLVQPTGMVCLPDVQIPDEGSSIWRLLRGSLHGQTAELCSCEYFNFSLALTIFTSHIEPISDHLSQPLLSAAPLQAPADAGR
jgi:hypothetical protein